MVSAVGGAANFSNFAAVRSVQQNPQERFASADTDGSDSLSLEEYQSFAPDFVEDVEGSFTQIDANGDGSLTDYELSSFAESQGLQGGRPPGPPPGGGGTSETDELSLIEQLLADIAENDEDIFNVIDSDDDGAISSAELQISADQIKTSFFNTLLEAQEEAYA